MGAPDGWIPTEILFRLKTGLKLPVHIPDLKTAALAAQGRLLLKGGLDWEGPFQTILAAEASPECLLVAPFPNWKRHLLASHMARTAVALKEHGILKRDCKTIKDVSLLRDGKPCSNLQQALTRKLEEPRDVAAARACAALAVRM